MSEKKVEPVDNKLLRMGLICAATAVIEGIEWQEMPQDSSFSHPAALVFGIAAIVLLFLAGAKR